MYVNALLYLLKTHSPVVNDRLVHVTAIMVPETPVFLLALINEVADVIVSAISQTSQNAQLSFCSRISLYLKALGTINNVFSQANLQLDLSNHAVETPSVELNISGHLFPNQELKFLHSSVLRFTFKLPIQPFLVALLADQQLLLMLIDVKFEQVFTHQILNLPLIALDLVLHSHSLGISVFVEPSPDSLNLLDPDLVCSV